MMWFKINKRFWVDLTQIREFGIPRNGSSSVTITFKDGTTETYGVSDQDETLARFEEAIKQFEIMRVITPDYGELPFGMD